MDGVLEGGLSFQGVSDLARTLLRCSKGGTASGEELLDVANTLAAARRLRRQIDEPELRPVCTTLLRDVATQERARRRPPRREPRTWARPRIDHRLAHGQVDR